MNRSTFMYYAFAAAIFAVPHAVAQTPVATPPSDMPPGCPPAMMDVDNDGNISSEEHSAFAAQMFALRDTNADGILDNSERVAMRRGGCPMMRRGRGKGFSQGQGRPGMPQSRRGDGMGRGPGGREP